MIIISATGTWRSPKSTPRRTWTRSRARSRRWGSQNADREGASEMRPMGQGCGSSPQVTGSEIAAVTLQWTRSSSDSPSGFGHKEVAMRRTQTTIDLSVRITDRILKFVKDVAAAVRCWGHGNGLSPSA